MLYQFWHKILFHLNHKFFELFHLNHTLHVGGGVDRGPCSALLNNIVLYVGVEDM